MSITIIGGCPGTGKSTVSRLLALRAENGVYLETDKFFDFVANKIDPSTKPARQQNETVLKAWCAAARSYNKGGYEVYVDGVIGPWWFETLNTELGKFDYVMLTADLAVCQQRVLARDGQPSATAGIVSRMHEQFAISDFSGTCICTNDLTPDQVLALIP